MTAPMPREELLVIIADAYNRGFSEGMREHTTSRGGQPWGYYKKKYEEQLRPLLPGVAQSQMTELEAAQAIAAVANECCYRSDGWEEAIADTALKTIRSLRPPNPAQSGEYDKLLTSWAECRQLLSDQRKKNDDLIAEIERLRAGVAQQPWQSIETAPKDGPAFLIWLPENLCIYEVIARDGNLSIFGGGFRDNLHRATLWQPLPVPPSNQGASK